MNENQQLTIKNTIFRPMSIKELTDILELTIKKDDENKIITFLCQLSAYTEGNQFNVSFNAPSSTGKSYIPLEVAKLFPSEDVMKLGSCSPTAFFHEGGNYDKTKNIITLDLSRKIIIFLDQPNNELLARLRPLLSHDEKEIHSKITDKNQKGGNRTKTVIIRGYPSVIFCSAGLNIDEQEGTRFLLLSPGLDKEKVKAAIREKIDKETDIEAYRNKLNNDVSRNLLKERILAIREEKIDEIKIKSPEKIKERFFRKHKKLLSRYTRDIGRIMSLVKALALLNLWWRKRNDSTIEANKRDIEEAFKIWEKISTSQEYNLPPYVYELYEKVILQLFEERGGQSGLTKQDIFQKHYHVNGQHLADWQLRKHILPMLESSGLITLESDPGDKRKTLICQPMPPSEI